MADLLNKLYSYDNFSLYLTIAIVVLVILFIIVLFFGKKDQKERELEATKKLQQLENPDAFKQEENAYKVEITPQANIENDTIMVPKVEDVAINNMVTPEVNANIPEPIEEPVIAPVMNTEENELPSNEFNNFEIPAEEIKITEPVFNAEPELPKDDSVSPQPVFARETETPFVFNDDVNPEVPEFNLDDVLNTAEKVKEEVVPEPKKEIFSSVYVPKKDETEDDLEMELPSLKKEEEKPEEIEKPVLNDYNLDELSGETYNINKD